MPEDKTITGTQAGCLEFHNRGGMPQEDEMRSYDRMDRSKIDAFFKEFPFLNMDFVGIRKDGVRRIYVSRVNERLLEYKPFRREDDGFLEAVRSLGNHGYHHATRTLILGREGNLLAEVGQEGWYYPSGRANAKFLSRFFTPRHEGETIGHALRGLEKHAAFIVLMENDDTEKRPWEEAVIYKTPHDFPTISVWLEELRRRSVAKVRAETSAIDAEGAPAN